MKAIIAIPLFLLATNLALASQENANIIRTAAPVLYVANGNTEDAGSSITPISISFSNGEIPTAQVGASYYFDLNSLVAWKDIPSGSPVPNIIWSAPTILPKGIILGGNGVLNGSPTEAGSHYFEITAAGAGVEAKKQFQLEVSPSIANKSVIISSTKSIYGTIYNGYMKPDINYPTGLGEIEGKYLTNKAKNTTYEVVNLNFLYFAGAHRLMLDLKNTSSGIDSMNPELGTTLVINGLSKEFRFIDAYSGATNSLTQENYRLG